KALGAAVAASLATLAGLASAVPGYVTSSGDMAVMSGSGQCVRSGEWTPSMAKDPCDPVPRAAQPAPVAQAPVEQPAPAPAPIAAAPIAAAPAPVIQKLTLNTDVLFEFNKAELRSSGQQKLDDLERRAQAVKDYLAQKGVSDQRVEAAGRGESQPVTGDQCKSMGKEHKSNSKLVSCLAPDRRVDIELLGSREVAGTTPSSSGSSSGGSTSGSSGSSR